MITLLAIGIATSAALFGSHASWTAQTTNPGNSVTAGTIQLDSSKPTGDWIFQAMDVLPGQSGSGAVTLTNNSAGPLTVSLTQDQLSSSGIEASLGLKIHDDTRNWCYWPVSQAGVCPAAYGAWDATSSITNRALSAAGGGAAWPTGEAHTFTISWQLAASSPNSDQGKIGSFRLRWNATT
ncbi:MAG: hypothetical protein ABI200_01390 [Gaiellales bacterium]